MGLGIFWAFTKVILLFSHARLSCYIESILTIHVIFKELYNNAAGYFLINYWKPNNFINSINQAFNSVIFLSISEKMQWGYLLLGIMYPKDVKNISGYNFIIPWMKIGSETSKLHWKFSDFFFLKVLGRLQFLFHYIWALSLFTIMFSHLMIYFTYEKKSVNCKPYFVNISFLTLSCSNLYFSVKNNIIAWKSSSIC